MSGGDKTWARLVLGPRVLEASERVSNTLAYTEDDETLQALEQINKLLWSLRLELDIDESAVAQAFDLHTKASEAAK